MLRLGRPVAVSADDGRRGTVIRVLIVAQVRLFREGLAEALGRNLRLEIVGTAAGGESLAAEIAAAAPDVVLVDVQAPGTLTAVRGLTLSDPGLKVVALGGFESELEVIECAEAGVAGYVTRDDGLDEVTATLASVVQDETLCSPRIAAVLLRRVATLAAERPPWPDGARLTGRELDVLELIDEGLSNKQIAARLCIELATVKNHVHNILEKLAVSRRADAVVSVRAQGLLRRPFPRTVG